MRLFQVVKHEDSSGNVAFFFERPPEVVFGGSEGNVLKETTTHDLGEVLEIRRIAVFHGLDRGDIAEMDTEVFSAFGIPLFQRSDHKETPASFAAWTTERPPMILTRRVDIALLGRVTGQNLTLWESAFEGERKGNRWTIRPHWGVRLVCSREL